MNNESYHRTQASTNGYGVRTTWNKDTQEVGESS